MPDFTLSLRSSPALSKSRDAGRQKKTQASRPATDAPLRMAYGLSFSSIAAKGALEPRVPEKSATALAGVADGGRQASPTDRERPPGVIVRAEDGPVQPEEPVPFDSAPTVPMPRRPEADNRRAALPESASGSPILPDSSDERWAMAPIRWSGNTLTTLNVFTSDNAISIANTNGIELNASSFIVAPYLAQWSGQFGYTGVGAKFSPDKGSVVKSESDSLSYSGTLNLFPISRFPLSLTLRGGTSQAQAGGDNGSKSSNTGVDARQSYRTEDGRGQYTAGYQRDTFTSGNNTGLFSSLQGGFSTYREFESGHLLEGPHQFAANLLFNAAEGDTQGQSLQQFNSTLSHSWTVHEDLSLSNRLTLASNQSNQVLGTALTSGESTIVLGENTFTWRPLEDVPLTVTGGANFSQTTQGSGRDQGDLRNLGAYVSGTYRFNNNLSASGSGSFFATSFANTRITTGTLNASVSYSGDPVKLGEFNYGWGVGAGASNSFSNVAGGSVGFNASANHGLMRTIVIGNANVVNLNASQSVAHNEFPSGSSSSLSHSIAGAWSAAYGADLTANISANFTDSLNFGRTDSGRLEKVSVSDENRYQNISLLGSVAYQVSSRAALSLNANLTWNQNKSDNDTNQVVNGFSNNNAATQVTGTLWIGYTHRSPFSIPLLNYTGNMLFVNSQSDQNNAIFLRQSNPGSTSFSFQQFVDYRLGRLIFRLDNTLISQDGKKSASWFGSVRREFDGIF